MTQRTYPHKWIEIKDKTSFRGFTRYKLRTGPYANKKEALRYAAEVRKEFGYGARVVSIYDKPSSGTKVKQSPNYYVYSK